MSAPEMLQSCVINYINHKGQLLFVTWQKTKTLKHTLQQDFSWPFFWGTMETTQVTGICACKAELHAHP